MSFMVTIIGGATFDTSIKSLFEEYGLELVHYNARKSSDLKKQSIPKNTLGAIITVDRSHMVFGNSNDITRYLVNNNIPYVFSSGNFASLNSSKILIQKIFEAFPDKIKKHETLSESDLKLDYYKNTWNSFNKKYLSFVETFFHFNDEWDKRFSEWKKSLDNWKFFILDWKEKQKKYAKLKFKVAKFNEWKEKLHEKGLEIEKQINIANAWKQDIENTLNTINNKHSKLEQIITSLNDLSDKVQKQNFRLWKTDFISWCEHIELANGEIEECLDHITKVFDVGPVWEKQVNLWVLTIKDIEKL